MVKNKTKLTKRETEILTEYMFGDRCMEYISKKNFIALTTVQHHLAECRRLTGSKTTRHAGIMAYKMGLIVDPNDVAGGEK